MTSTLTNYLSISQRRTNEGLSPLSPKISNNVFRELTCDEKSPPKKQEKAIIDPVLLLGDLPQPSETKINASAVSVRSVRSKQKPAEPVPPLGRTPLVKKDGKFLKPRLQQLDLSLQAQTKVDIKEQVELM